MKRPGDASLLYDVYQTAQTPLRRSAAERAERALFWRIVGWCAVTAAIVVACGILLGAWLGAGA